jgi:ribosome-binding factor A
MSAERKSRQLCRQVHEELELAFGELDDPLLDGLAIFAVDVEAGGATLRVGVIVPDDRDPSAVRARLDAAKGQLRSEIASAIHRKRTPQLWFALIPARVVADSPHHAEPE